METEHTKPINNEHVEKSQGDGTPLLDEKIRDVAVVPSPIPLHETDADPKGSPTHSPSSEENLPLQALHEEHSPQMQSPPIQTMGPNTPPGYDPSRIPTSIFSSKSTNPAEWSVTSNESLFSIHMGNNSFSRDYAILFGKSGDAQDWNGSELPRLDDWTNTANNNAIPKSCELISLPTVMESPSHEESTSQNVAVERAPDVRKAMPDETTPLTTPPCSPPSEKHEKEQVFHDEVVDVKKPTPAERVSNQPPTLQSPPRFSNDSGNSGNSFAFPVLVGDGGKPESLKVVPEQPEPPESHDSKETLNAPATSRWYSFLMCWPRCCY